MYSVVGADGQVYGPVDMATLQQWIAEARVTPHTVLIDGVTGSTGPAMSFPVVQPLFPAIAPPQNFIQPYGQQPAMGSPYQPQIYGNQNQPMPRQQGQGNVQVVVNNVMPGAPGMPYDSGYKSKLTAALLAFFLGGIGIHQFYLGKTGHGIAMILIVFLTCGYGGIITGIWALIDFVVILTGGARDSKGYPLV